MKQLASTRGFWDAILLLVIFVGGEQIGSRYVETFQQTAHGEFYQAEFAPAVLSACGREFGVNATPVPALNAFLSLRADEFSCDQLPRDLKIELPEYFQTHHRYLLVAAAWTWKVTGVSWRRLAPLFGVFFAITLCATYGLFRIAGGPAVGLLGVLPLAVSAHHLAYLPHLRDYAKAPLVLLPLLMAVQLTRPPLRPRRSLLLAIAFGLSVGIGFGFRNDLLISLPPFAIAVLWLTPGSWRENLPLKAGCLALAAVMFVVSAWPILGAYRTSRGSGHIAVQGLMSSFDAPLGVTRPLYDVGTLYLDGFTAVVITAYGHLRTGRFADYLSAEYDAAAFDLMKAYVRHWPADMFTRGLASALEVLEFPFTSGELRPATPYGITAPWILSFYQWQAAVLHALSGLGVVMAVAATLIISATSVSAGLAFFLLLAYYAGYPAVQFDLRHAFHLEIIAWWVLAFVVVSACRFVRTAIVDRRSLKTPFALRNAAIVAATMAIAIFAPTTVLRAYQQRHVASLVDGYLVLPRTPLAITRGAAPDGSALVTMDALWADRKADEPVGLRYLVVELAAGGCGATSLPLTVKYDASTGDNDFSYFSRVGVDADGPTLRVVPVYYNRAYTQFRGFELPRGYGSCLKSVSRIDDLASVPLAVDLTLAPHWHASTLFQRLSAWEDDTDPPETTVRVVPGDMAVPVAAQISTQDVLTAAEVTPGIAVNSSEHRWFTSEPVHVANARQVWLRFPQQPVPAGMTLRVEGTIRHGGVRIATTQSGHVVDSRAMTSPGAFAVLLAAPDAGPFGVLVTDESSVGWKRQPDSLLRAGVSRVAPWMLTSDFELHGVAWIARAQ